MKRNSVYTLTILLFFAIVLTSCSGMMGGTLGYYYNQQSNSEPAIQPPPVEEEEDETGGTNEEGGLRDLTLFEILLPDGKIDEEKLANFTPEEQLLIPTLLPIKQTDENGVPLITKVDTASYITNKVISISKIDTYAPIMNYKDATWTKINDYRYKASGSGFSINAPMNVTSSGITFYMYDGINPEYALDDKANLNSYGDGSESRVNRFVFYEITGKASIASLWNMLVCVDTYTNLIFAFAYPSKFDSVGNPTDWAGLSKSFYFYDPVGYVDDNGNFVIHKWYTEKLNKKQFSYVQKTGKSPYSYVTKIAASNEEAFLSNIKDKIFMYRDNTVNSSVLEKYSTSLDGRTIEKTTQAWGSNTVSNPTVFDTPVITSATSATYGDTTYTLNEDATTLTVIKGGVSKLAVLAENYVEKGPLFTYRVKGKKYSFRDYTLGKSEWLHTFEFNADATEVTYNLQKHRHNSDTIGTFTIDPIATKELSAKYDSYEFTLSDDSKTLYLDGIKVGTHEFSDKGPLFEDRVKGLIYSGSGYTYVFSEDGKKITSGDTTYTVSGNGMSGDGGRTFKVYESNKGILGFDDYGIRLYSENSGEDNVIKWTDAQVGSGTPSYFLATGYKATMVDRIVTQLDSIKTDKENVSIVANENITDSSWDIDINATIVGTSDSDSIDIPLSFNFDDIDENRPVKIEVLSAGTNITVSESTVNDNSVVLTLTHTGKGKDGAITLKATGPAGIYDGLPLIFNIKTKTPGFVKVDNFIHTDSNENITTSMENNKFNIQIEDTVATYKNDSYTVPVSFALNNVITEYPLKVSAVNTEAIELSTIDITNNIASFGVTLKGLGSIKGVSENIVLTVDVDDSKNNGIYLNLPLDITLSTTRKTNYDAIYEEVFINAIKTKEFSYRGGVGSSEILETYTVSDAGIITKETTNWRTDAVVKETYSFVKATSENTAVYKNDSSEDITFTINADVSELAVSDQNSKTYVTSFTDLGVLFVDKIRDNVYTYRRPVGNSEILDKYYVSSDGKTITHKTHTWRADSEVEVGVYSLSNEKDSSNATFVDTKATLSDLTVTVTDYRTITIGSTNYITNLTDKGPLFQDRVKGKTFKGKLASTGIIRNWKYEFSSDGTTITVYAWTRDGNVFKEWYWKKDGEYSVHQRDSNTYEGAYDHGSGYYGMKLSNNDEILKFSSVSLVDINQGAIVWEDSATLQQ